MTIIDYRPHMYYFVFYCIYLTCNNVILGLLAIMVGPEWISRFIEFFYILVSKTLKMVET